MQPLPLPANWIDALFARLTGLYGNRFTNMWANIDAVLVRTTWASELAGVRPEAIKYALDHLPDDFPPTALQFKKVCSMRPDPGPVLTYDAPASPEVRNALVSRLSRHQARGNKDWAEALRVRHVACERLNANQIRCYRAALGLGATA